jgi:hypothetical protein
MMHRLSIAFACAAVVLASQASLALSHDDARFYLARANTSLEQFRHDRGECEQKAETGGSANHHVTQRAPEYPLWPGASPNDKYAGYDYLAAKFLRCMAAKGYQKATWSTGFHTGKLFW